MRQSTSTVVDEAVAPHGVGLGRPAPPEVVTEPTAAGNGSGPGSLGRRFFRPQTLVSFGIAAAILLFFLWRLEIDPGEVWREMRRANPWIFGLAFAVWYGSFFLRAYRWRLMLARVDIDRAHGYPVPGERGMVEIFLLSWFANCVVPAKLGDAYRSYLLKQKTGASFSTTLGTILAERLTDLTVLFLAMCGVGVVVFHGRVPTEATQAFVLGLALLGLAAIGLGAMSVFRHGLQRRLPARVREQYGRLHDAVFRCLRRPWSFLALSAVIWLSEGLRFWLAARALDAGISPTTAFFVALMGSLLTTLPFTPAGLGLVEAGATGVLIGVFGMNPSSALSIILLDRVVAYWSLIVVGLAVYMRRLRLDGRAAGRAQRAER